MKLKLSRLTRILLFSTVTFGLYAYLLVDGEVPIHFNETGRADDSAPKYVLLVIPFGVIVIVVFMCNIAKDSKLAKYEDSFKINEQVVEWINLVLVAGTLGFLWFIQNQIS